MTAFLSLPNESKNSVTKKTVIANIQTWQRCFNGRYWNLSSVKHFPIDKHIYWIWNICILHKHPGTKHCKHHTAIKTKTLVWLLGIIIAGKVVCSNKSKRGTRVAIVIFTHNVDTRHYDCTRLIVIRQEGISVLAKRYAFVIKFQTVKMKWKFLNLNYIPLIALCRFEFP